MVHRWSISHLFRRHRHRDEIPPNAEANGSFVGTNTNNRHTEERRRRKKLLIESTTKPLHRRHSDYLLPKEDEGVEEKSATVELMIPSAPPTPSSPASSSPPPSSLFASLFFRLFPGPNVGPSLDTFPDQATRDGTKWHVWQQIQHKPHQMRRLFCTIPGSPMYPTGFPPLSSLFPPIPFFSSSSPSSPDQQLNSRARIPNSSSSSRIKGSGLLTEPQPSPQCNRRPNYFYDYLVGKTHYYDRYFLFNYTANSFMYVDSQDDVVAPLPVNTSAHHHGPCRCRVCREWPVNLGLHDENSKVGHGYGYHLHSYHENHYDTPSPAEAPTPAVTATTDHPPRCLTVFFWTFSAPEHFILLYLFAFFIPFLKEAVSGLMNTRAEGSAATDSSTTEGGGGVKALSVAHTTLQSVPGAGDPPTPPHAVQSCGNDLCPTMMPSRQASVASIHAPCHGSGVFVDGATPKNKYVPTTTVPPLTLNRSSSKKSTPTHSSSNFTTSGSGQSCCHGHSSSDETEQTIKVFPSGEEDPCCSNHVSGMSIPNKKAALQRSASASSTPPFLSPFIPALTGSSGGGAGGGTCCGGCKTCGCDDGCDCNSISSWVALVECLIFGLHIGMAYCVMQLVMTYDATVFTLVCVGTTAGHALFQVYLPAARRRRNVMKKE